MLYMGANGIISDDEDESMKRLMNGDPIGNQFHDAVVSVIKTFPKDLLDEFEGRGISVEIDRDRWDSYYDQKGKVTIGVCTFHCFRRGDIEAMKGAIFHELAHAITLTLRPTDRVYSHDQGEELAIRFAIDNGMGEQTIAAFRRHSEVHQEAMEESEKWIEYATKLDT